MTEFQLISISHSGVVKTIVVAPSISVDEINQLVRASFSLGAHDIVGLCDTQQRVTFPLSLCCTAPQYFSNRPSSSPPYELVLAKAGR